MLKFLTFKNPNNTKSQIWISFFLCAPFCFSQMAKEIIEESFANHIRTLISSNKTQDPQRYNFTEYLDSLGTTHVSVLAKDGSAVAVTSSINDMSVSEFCFHTGSYTVFKGVTTCWALMILEWEVKETSSGLKLKPEVFKYWRKRHTFFFSLSTVKSDHLLF